LATSLSATATRMIAAVRSRVAFATMRSTRRIISAAARPASIGLPVRSDTMSWQNLVVRETKASRRLDDLALFVGGRVGRHVLSVGLFIDGALRR
jgi:hypothetical protein